MKKIIITTIIIFNCFLPLQVKAQSADNISPRFDASSNKAQYILLNYDCSSLPWPSNVKEVYRRINYEGEFPTAMSFYVFEGETTLDLERQSANGNEAILSYIDFLPIAKKISKTERNNPFNEPSRRIPPPVLDPETGEVVCADWNFLIVDTENRLLKLEKPSSEIYQEYTDKDKLVTITEANLIPPPLQQLENMALEIIYIVFAMISIISVLSLIYTGFRFMTSGFSPEQKGAELSRLTWWAVGLIAAIIAFPAMQTLYKFIGINSSRCYYYAEDCSEELANCKDRCGNDETCINNCATNCIPASGTTKCIECIDEYGENTEECKKFCEGSKREIYNLTAPGFTFFFQDTCTNPYDVDTE